MRSRAATQQVEALFGKSEISELLAASYRKGETFGTAFREVLYQSIFRDGRGLPEPSR